MHFGSRGLGKTATAFTLAGGQDGIDVEPTVLHQDSELGQKYVAGMSLAGEYAYAGREWVVERVRAIIGGTSPTAFTTTTTTPGGNPRRSRALGRSQGATPAFPASVVSPALHGR